MIWLVHVDHFSGYGGEPAPRRGVGKLRERHRRIRRKRERVREVETDRHREQRIGKESEREKMLKGAMFHV